MRNTPALSLFAEWVEREEVAITCAAAIGLPAASVTMPRIAPEPAARETPPVRTTNAAISAATVEEDFKVGRPLS